MTIAFSDQLNTILLLLLCQALMCDLLLSFFFIAPDLSTIPECLGQSEKQFLLVFFKKEKSAMVTS